MEQHVRQVVGDQDKNISTARFGLFSWPCECEEEEKDGQVGSKALAIFGDNLSQTCMCVCVCVCV